MAFTRQVIAGRTISVSDANLTSPVPAAYFSGSIKDAFSRRAAEQQGQTAYN